MSSLDPFPGNDVPGEYVLVETNSPCISCAASTGVESPHGGSVLDFGKTEWVCLPRFELPLFLLVFTIVRCFVLFHLTDRVTD